MPKNKKSAKGGTGISKKTSAASRSPRKTRSDKKEASGSDSSSELEAVKTKKGEPANNLRQRAQWFQKRHGG